jgi:acetylornithine deacetylase/succinyl-diaminopimelate desuccinylase-like protein
VKERIISLTSDLVAIPTHEEEQEAQAYLARTLEACGFECELQEVEPGRPNLVAHRDGRGGVFLNSHIDTHPPHSHPDPFTCRVQGGLLVGRGVVDTKGQIGAVVAALEAEPDARALVVITCDEERLGKGSAAVSFPDGPWTTDGGIVFEPTDFAICTAQPGNVDIRVDVSAESTHAYAIEPGTSAIHAVLSAIEELDTCRFLKTDHPLLGRPRANIGRIEGGEHAWRTPARASLEMTLGVVPGTDVDEAAREVGDRLEEIARRWGARGTSFLYEIVDTSEPTEVQPSQVPIASRLAAAMDSTFEPAGMPSWTDAGYLLTKHNQPCVIFGAGSLTTAHSNHESVPISDLVRLCTIIRRLLVA